MACYLCGHSEFKVRKGAVRDAPSLSIHECRRCALVTLSSLGHITPDHYQNSGMHGGQVPSMEAWLRETEADDERRFRMLEALMVNRRVLDFGSGAGGFVRKAATSAGAVVGIELERRVHEHWGDALTLRASLDEVDGAFDVITAFHVVEHSDDPRRMLRDLASRLSAGGRLVIEVPSAEDALLTLYDNDAFQRFTYWSQHLFLFNAETLRQLALQAGLGVLAVQQFQRYSLSNHLHWLSRNAPGGHRQWAFLDTPELTAAYASSLASVGKCDTLIAHLTTS